MSVPERLAALTGRWTGTNRVWLAPGEAAHVSETTATVRVVAQGRFLEVAYAWAFDGEPHDGVVLLGRDGKSAAWIDSWHMGDKVMLLEGAPDASGAVSVQGAYAAPPGPDWGWRIVVEGGDDEPLHLVMYNVTPDGTEMLAVDAAYARTE